jgi:hypothetical protein
MKLAALNPRRPMPFGALFVETGMSANAASVDMP